MSAAAIRQQQLHQQQILLAGMAGRLGENSTEDANTSLGRRMSMAATATTSTNGSSGSGGSGSTGYPITSTPFTPKQQQALMRLNGNAALSQDAAMAAQQYQYAMMMQAQAAAYHQHQQQQQRQASMMAIAGLPGHSRGAHQQHQHYSPQYATATSTVPGVPWHPAGSSIASMENHHQMQLQLQLQRQQHHQAQAQAQTHFQYQNSLIYPPSSAGSPSSSQSLIFPSGSQQQQQQYHFVGGEPSNAYRLVTQSQLAQLQNTPIPSSVPTPAVPLSIAAVKSATTPSSASVFHASTSGVGGSCVGRGSTASPVKKHEQLHSSASSSSSSVENNMQVEDTSDPQRMNSNASTELNPPQAASAAHRAQMTRPTMHASGSNTTVGGQSTASTSSPPQGGSSTSSPPSATTLNGQKQALGRNGNANANGHRSANKTPPLHLDDTLRNGSTSSLTVSDTQEGTSQPSSIEPFTSTSAPTTVDAQQRDNTVQSTMSTSPSSSQVHPIRQSQPTTVIPNNQTATSTSPSGSVSGNATQASMTSTSPNSTMARMDQQRSHKNGNVAVTSVSEASEKQSQPTSVDPNANENGEKRKLSDRRPTLTVDTSFIAPDSAATASVRQQQSAPHQQAQQQQQQQQQQQLSRQASNQQRQQEAYQQQQQQQQQRMPMQAQLQPAMYEVANAMQHQQMPIYTLQVAPPPMATAYNQASAPGYATLRTLQLNSALTLAFKKQDSSAIDLCINEYFQKEAKFKFSMSDEERNEINSEYLIPMCAIGRFYESMRRCGATSIQLVLDDPREWVLGPDPERNSVMTEDGISGYLVESPHATLIVTYSSGSSVFSRGSCRALYHYQQAEPVVDAHGILLAGYPQMTLLLTQLEYDFVEHTEMVSRRVIKPKVTALQSSRDACKEPTAQVEHTAPATNSRKHNEIDSETADADANARPAKRPKTETQSGSEEDDRSFRTADQVPNQNVALKNEYNPGFREYAIPGPPVRDCGLSDETMRVLEIGEAVDHLGELICFSLLNNLSPLEALEHYATLSVKAGFVPDPRVGGVSEGGADLTQAVAQA